jgi:hypothetical protein
MKARRSSRGSGLWRGPLFALTVSLMLLYQHSIGQVPVRIVYGSAKYVDYVSAPSTTTKQNISLPIRLLKSGFVYEVLLDVQTQDPGRSWSSPFHIVSRLPNRSMDTLLVNERRLRITGGSSTRLTFHVTTRKKGVASFSILDAVDRAGRAPHVTDISIKLFLK